MEERNRLEERNLSHGRVRRSSGSGLLSTIATVVILAGAGMAGASQSNGGQVADQAKSAITGSSHAPSADAVGSGHEAGGGESTGASTNGGTSVDPGTGTGPGSGDNGAGIGGQGTGHDHGTGTGTGTSHGHGTGHGG